MRSDIDANGATAFSKRGLGYYRSLTDDIAAVARLREDPIATPTLAIGGPVRDRL